MIAGKTRVIGSSKTAVAFFVGVLSVVSRRTEVLGLEVAESSLEEIRLAACDRRLLFYYLIEDALPLLIVVSRAGQRLGTDFVSVCGDTWMGRTISGVLERLGRRALPFRFSHAALSLRDVKALVREPAPLTISADGRGPHGRVHPRLSRLIEGRGAIAIPLSVSATCVFKLGTVGRMRSPLPGGRLAIAVGSPLMPSGEGSPLSTEALDQGLREARAASLRLLAGSRLRG